MSLALLNRNPVTWDSEAASYLTSVETADAQSLEPAVSRAINTFVIDCKVRGIWGSIKSSCLLCGPRTLNGALVPLKGTAPTNNNFVSSDYNRETGLKGDGSSKYINTNRNYSTDPQNNQHMCVYISSFDTKPQASGSTAYIGSGTSTGGGINGKDGSNNRIYFRNQNVTPYTTGLDVSTVTGLLGSYRNNSSDYTIRINGKNLLYSQSSQAPLNANIFVFAIPGPLFYTNGRLSFYSIGESLDLRLLEQCVENYNNSLSRIFTSSYIISDTDAATYIALVEAADKTSLSYAYRKGVNDFIAGCKSDNIWTSLKSSCILIGARTLNGILVPLVGTAPTNNGFLSSNYNRNFGLSNSSRLYYLNSNRDNSTDPQDNQHLSVFTTFPESTTTEYQYIGVGTNTTGSTHISTNANRRSRNGTAASTSPTPLYNTLIGISRSNSASFVSRTNSTNTTNNIVSQTPSIGSIGVFSRDSGFGITNATLAFYSIGTSLDLALLDNRVTTLINELSAARSL